MQRSAWVGATWAYHAAISLPTTKTYADDTHVDYSYPADGRIATRARARGVR